MAATAALYTARAVLLAIKSSLRTCHDETVDWINKHTCSLPHCHQQHPALKVPDALPSRVGVNIMIVGLEYLLMDSPGQREVVPS